ncbi:hypothetical protein CEUSTIGMA_g6641.t1 [Chlamydomonas eustigma]|uniref:Uncharacterized protein n=1 Tax=Chlamydomonas eustigma TaxID=1157962 RepID=A0A250X7Y7_9CHLO|nr:hypothetical protein CEUSTIGMA_g6641.t1 [Chlamydomonas eustigma]|eukprot:GAX79201.1 hypothetical protein CEUSTIGMA_g6641.t1 [Chlamydomonas eustigma]
MNLFKKNFNPEGNSELNAASSDGPGDKVTQFVNPLNNVVSYAQPAATNDKKSDEPSSSSLSGQSAGLQGLMGANLIFTTFLPYWIATGMQDTHFQLGLIIATGISGGNIVIGALLIFLKLRRVYPYVLEIAMLAIFPVLMAISIAVSGADIVLINNFNFIVNSALAGVTLISMIVTYPCGVQHVQELVPWLYHGHADVVNAGYVTSGVMCCAFIISCLLYLVPLTKGFQNDHMNPFNLVFRLILPEVLTFLAVLFTRLWGSSFTSHLQVYDSAVQLQSPGSTSYNIKSAQGRYTSAQSGPPLRVIDNAMLQPYPPIKVPAVLPTSVFSLASSGHPAPPQDAISAYYQKKSNLVQPLPASQQPQLGPYVHDKLMPKSMYPMQPWSNQQHLSHQQQEIMLRQQQIMQQQQQIMQQQQQQQQK